MQATVDVAATAGFLGFDVADVAATAGIAPRTFYRYFASKQAAFEAGHRVICRELRDVAWSAVENERVPYDRAIACLSSLMTYFAADPARAQVLFVEGPAAGPQTRAACKETMTDLQGLFVAMGGDPPLLAGVPAVAAEVAVGGVFEVVRTRTADGRLHELPGLVADLTALLGAPYCTTPGRPGGAPSPEPGDGRSMVGS